MDAWRALEKDIKEQRALDASNIKKDDERN